MKKQGRSSRLRLYRQRNSAQIVENTAEGTKVADIKTKIVRIDDSEDAEESNSYMPAKQLEELLKENGFTKTVSYMLFGA